MGISRRIAGANSFMLAMTSLSIQIESDCPAKDFPLGVAILDGLPKRGLVLAIHAQIFGRDAEHPAH